jgi:hypothetical protein
MRKITIILAALVLSTSLHADGIINGGGSGGSAGCCTVAADKSDEQAGTSATLITTPSQQQQHASAAKAWVYATPSGGTYTNAANYNTSITKAATGTITLTWGTAFASTNYALVCSLNQSGIPITISEAFSSRLAGSAQVLIQNATTTIDEAFSCVAFGGQ